MNNKYEIDEKKKYIFRKPYVTDSGTIPEGTEINFFRGWIYINGGMADSFSKNLIMSIFMDAKKRHEYLVPMQIIENKI